jgi:hypothetical protein
MISVMALMSLIPFTIVDTYHFLEDPDICNVHCDYDVFYFNPVSSEIYSKPISDLFWGIEENYSNRLELSSVEIFKL